MRFAIALAICSIVAASQPSAAREPLDTFLLRVSRASGAPYRYHIVSVSHETLLGRRYDVTTDSDGPRYRVRRCSRGLCSGSYFDGIHRFDTTFNDTPLPREGGVDVVEATLGAIVSYAFTAPAFRRAGGEIVERAELSRGGKRFRRIAVALPHGPFFDALVDPQSALVSAVVSDDGKLAFDLNDVRRIDGVALPFSIVRDGTEIQRFERRSIAPVPLGMPAGVVPTISAHGSPLAMLQGAHASDLPVVPCSLGGHAAACLFDTGNSGLSISLELAEALGLEPRGSALDISGVGRYVTGIVTAPALTAGPAVYPPADYAVLHDLHRYGYDVVLGADAFAHARVTIDYANREVRYPGTDAAPDQDALAVNFVNFIPVVTVALGDVTAPLAIDTGDESSINLAADFFAQHRSIFEPSGSRMVAGIGAESTQLTGVLPFLRLGAFVVDRPGIAATTGLQPTAKGHIGSGLLRHFSVTFDYARSRLELVPRVNDAAVRTAVPPEPLPASKR